MRNIHPSILAVICSLIITAALPLAGAELRIRNGRPFAEGVYVNGHGPYEFLVDTGTNVDLIETGLARKIGMTATSRADLATAAGSVSTEGSEGNEVRLDSLKTDGQRFLFSELEAIHRLSLDTRGVLGQWFLSRFDYLLDLRRKRLELGSREWSGVRSRFRLVNGRPVIETSLGNLALDSGATRLILYGLRRGDSSLRGQLETLGGVRPFSLMPVQLRIDDGRRVWSGDAVTLPGQPEPGVDGLLPLGFFKTVYVCNSEGYVVLD